jgi:hypothetical protein
MEAKRMIAESAIGQFNYLGSMTAPPVFHTEVPERGNLNLEPHLMPVRDMRQAQGTSAFAKQGFARVDLPLAIDSKMSVDAIAEKYHPPLMEVMRHITGAPKIVLTPPLMRWSEKIPHRKSVNSIPARYVHSDYDRDSFHALMKSIVADDPERDRWLSGRYAAYNTWRVLSPPPQDLPLAVIDRSTLSPEDFVLGTVVIDDGKKPMKFGQGLFHYNPTYRWSYISNMTSDDMLLFVGLDSADDRLPGNPHSAFENTLHGDKVIPRISCEVRAFVFWGN